MPSKLAIAQWSIFILVAWFFAFTLLRRGVYAGAVIFGIGVPILLFAFESFDQLVQLEHEHYHENWLADGKPNGFYWKPRELGWFDSGMARLRLSSLWLFRTPVWMKSLPAASAWLTRLRVSVIAWNLLFLAAAVLTIFFA